MRSVFAISRGVRGRSRLAAVLTLAVVALAASAASAMAKEVNIVSQGEPPKVLPAKTHYFKTIQEAVNASTARDIVLIEPGTYDEAVGSLLDKFTAVRPQPYAELHRGTPRVLMVKSYDLPAEQR